MGGAVKATHGGRSCQLYNVHPSAAASVKGVELVYDHPTLLHEIVVVASFAQMQPFVQQVWSFNVDKELWLLPA